jgi:hypothetical protein
MERKCGLVNPANPCRCARRIDHAVTAGRIDPERLLFATHPATHFPNEGTRDAIREIEGLHSAAELLRGHPEFAAPGAATDVLRVLLKPTRRGVLAD